MRGFRYLPMSFDLLPDPINPETERGLDEANLEETAVIVVQGRAKRSLLTAAGEYLIFVYLLCSAFILYLPHLPGPDVNPVNIISILLYLIAAIRSIWCRGTGLLNLRLAFWLMVATAIVASLSNPVLDVFHEVCVLLTFLSMFIILKSGDARTTMRKWMQRLLYMGILQGLVAIGIFWTWIPAPELTGIHAFNGERTGYIIDGMFGLLSELSGFWMLSAYQGRRSVVLSFTGIIMGVVNAVLSGYRSYAVAAAFVFVVFFAWTIRRKDWRLVVIQTMIGAALILVSLVDPTNRIEVMHQRILGVREYDPSLTWRQLESEQERYVIRQSPWTGSGWGLADRMRVSYLGDMPSYGHDYYTAFPARIGIPLTLYLSLSWMALGVAAVRRLRTCTDGETLATAWYVLTITCMVIGVSVVQNVAIMSRAFPLIAIFAVNMFKVDEVQSSEGDQAPTSRPYVDVGAYSTS